MIGAIILGAFLGGVVLGGGYMFFLLRQMREEEGYARQIEDLKEEVKGLKKELSDPYISRNIDYLMNYYEQEDLKEEVKYGKF